MRTPTHEGWNWGLELSPHKPSIQVGRDAPSERAGSTNAEQELRRANRALRTINECHQVLVRAHDESQLLEDICRLAVERGGYRMAWVGLAENDSSRSVRPAAYAGRDDGYLDKIKVSWGDNSYGHGPTGTAIRERRIFILQNIDSNPAYLPWREAARQHGYAASIALPLLTGDDECLGALCIYAVESRAFDDDEVELLTGLANDLAYGIKNLRNNAARDKSERLLREAVESVALGFTIYDPEDRLVICNEAHLNIYAASRDLIVPGARFEDIVRGGAERGQYKMARGEVDAWVHERVQQHQNPGGRRIEQALDDGRWILIIEHRTPSGYIVGNRIDITERKQLEAELERHRKHLEKEVAKRTDELSLANERLSETEFAMDRSGIAIHWVDAESGHFLNVNSHACVMLGYDRDEMLGMTVSDIDSNFSKDGFAEAVKPLRETRASRFETINRSKDGRLIPVEVACYFQPPQRDRGGRFIAFLSDISERRETELVIAAAREAAESANRAKSEFLSSMSHELRTPMNAILGFSQILSLDEALSNSQRDGIGEIYKAGQHLMSLINDVLDLARIDSGKVAVSLEPVELAPLFDECGRLVKPLASARQISIQSSDWNNLWVRADLVRLKQVLINLISNAVKYNRVNGSISLSWECIHPGFLRIVVADTGRGIPADRIKDLFQPFNRLGAENSAIEGTGIGLSITRKLVEMMDGHVGVESTPGLGSRFWVELPGAAAVADAQHVPDDDAEETGLAASAREQCVLCIDDNRINLKLIGQVLRARPNIRLITAHTPGQGIELAKALRPDLILLDINMPDMDGYQVLTVFKADPDLKNVPVVALTANAMPRDIERGLQAGFTAYVTKPIDVNHFLRTVDDVVEINTAR